MVSGKVAAMSFSLGCGAGDDLGAKKRRSTPGRVFLFSSPKGGLVRAATWLGPPVTERFFAFFPGLSKPLAAEA